VLGFCDLKRGLPHLGVEAMRAAVNHDPGSWETHYALALAQGSAGIDPRPSIRQAQRMNPFEPLVRRAVRRFSASSPTEWVTRAALVRADALRSNRLSIHPA
jgi:hypothetical protein